VPRASLRIAFGFRALFILLLSASTADGSGV
jgi:hypothetical protein